MSQLLIQWLNDEVQLSRKVTSFEADFSNGYLFGELLSKFNQQLNFEEFQDKELRSSKIKNFELLQQTFKTLNVKFNTQTVDGIIKKQTGVALQILYQLKMQLEKVNDPHDVLMHAKTGKYNAIVPLKRIRQPKEQFDKMETEFFGTKLNEMNKAQKEVNLDNHLEKFQRFAYQQAEKERKLKLKEETEERNLKEEMRKIQLNKLQRNMAFMEDWNQKGIENWKKNQQIRSKTKKGDQEFNMKMTNIQKVYHETMKEAVHKEMLDEIEAFEQRDPQQITSLGLKNKMMSEFMRKERDKRRRKMIVDQEKQTDELARREIAVLEKLKQQSKQEKEIMYEIWRAAQCEEVIAQNRMLRDENYKNKLELNVINLKFKEEEMLRALQSEFQIEVELQNKRQMEINIEYKLQIRQKNYEKCRLLVEKLFEISEQCWEHLQNNDSQNIADQFLREQNELFVEGEQLIPYKRFRTFDPLKQIKLQESLFTKQKQFLAEQEMRDYIQGTGQWQYQSQNNYTLGNLVRKLIESQFEKSNPTHLEMNIPNVPFRCSIIGFAFSGKRTVSELLQKKYGIQMLSIESIINELLEYARAHSENNVEHSELWDQEKLSLAQNILNTLFSGEQVTDEQYIDAIILKIKRSFKVQTFDEIYEEMSNQPTVAQRYEEVQVQEGLNWDDFHKANMVNTKPFAKGWLLYDFPHNYSQAVLLEKMLSGIQPQDEPTDLQKKINRAARIVAPNKLDILPRTKQESGVGVCVYLSMPSNELSLRRAFGRRDDAHTHSQYHLDSNVPPCDNAPLVERIKPIYEIDNLQQQISDKNAYFSTQVADLTNWYSNFETSAEVQIIEKRLIDVAPITNNVNLDELQEQPEIQQEYIEQEQITIQKEVQETFQIIDASNNVERVFYEVDKVIQRFLDLQAMQIKRKKEIQLEQQLQNQLNEQRLQQQQELDRKCIVRPLPNFEISTKAPIAVCEYLYRYWNTIEARYFNAVEGQLIRVREQREFVNNFMMDIQRKFIDLLTVPDEKFYFVRNYQETYNQFVLENADLCEEEACKEELHQRVDDLFDQLQDLTDQKKEDLIVEKNAIQQSQFIENEIDIYLNNTRVLLQAEIDRSSACIQMLTDYYSTLEGVELQDIQPATGELQLIDGDDSTRLNKLISESHRIFNGEEEVIEDKNKKGTKAVKKDEKKGKKGVVEEVKKELSNAEAVSAINLEKQIFKDRVEVIRVHAESNIRALRTGADLLYSKLDDWIHYTHTTEIKALETICRLFRQYIEREERIQKEVQLNNVDVVISHQILNFLTPIPPPLPAREPLNAERFSISQLYHLIEDLRAITNTHLLIETKALTLLLARSKILKLSAAKWMQCLKKIENNGYVNVRQIATYLILLNSPTPNEVDLKNYDLPAGLVTKEQFVNTPAWFDEYERVIEEESIVHLMQTQIISIEQCTSRNCYSLCIRMRVINCQAKHSQRSFKCPVHVTLIIQLMSNIEDFLESIAYSPVDVRRNYSLLGVLQKFEEEIEKEQEQAQTYLLMLITMPFSAERNVLVNQQKQKVLRTHMQLLALHRERINCAETIQIMYKKYNQQLDQEVEKYIDELRSVPQEQEDSIRKSTREPPKVEIASYKQTIPAKKHTRNKLDLEVPIPQEDPQNQPYCFCRRPSFGVMIACDHPGCKIEWFHVDCIKERGLQVSEGDNAEWYCPQCQR